MSTENRKLDLSASHVERVARHLFRAFDDAHRGHEPLHDYDVMAESAREDHGTLDNWHALARAAIQLGATLSPGVPFMTWFAEPPDKEPRNIIAGSAQQAAEQRAQEDGVFGTCCVRDERSGTIWRVEVEALTQQVFVAWECREVPMPAATHVLWGNTVLCEDLRLCGDQDTWPAEQRALTLGKLAAGAALPPDPCEVCWKRAPGLIAEIQQIGKADS